MNPFVLLTLAAALSMVIIPLAWRLAPRIGLIDVPDARKVHTVPMPRVGGWGITLGTVLPLLIFFRLDPLLQSFLLGSLTLFGFGIWDDARQIGHWKKFAGQAIAAGLVVYYGDLYVSRLPFLDQTLAPEIGRPLTILFLIGAINAANHSDGLDGLAGGESMLSLIALAVLGYAAGSALVVGVALTTMGGIIGFLRFNSHPARVFMGDCGSQVLGFTLGFLTLQLTQVAQTALSAALPLLLLGMPIADICAVLFQRIRGGMHWFRATRNHVHHRLLDLGFDHYQSVVVIYSVQAVLIVSGVLMRYQPDWAVAAFYLLVVGGLFAALTMAERSHWRLRQSAPGTRLAVAVQGMQGLTSRSVLRIAPRLIIVSLVPVLMLCAALSATMIPADFAVATAALAAALAVVTLRPGLEGGWVARLIVSTSAILSVYLMVHHPGPYARQVESASLALSMLLGVAVGVYLRCSRDRRFGTSPTDCLILLAVLTLTAFGSFDIDSRAFVELVFEAAVLIYGCEVSFEVAGPRILQLATLTMLVISTARGLL